MTRHAQSYVTGLVLVCLLGWGPAAQAQAEQSGGMGQGEARISVRSDVRLSIKGTRGTTTERLRRLTEALTDRMGDIRACYGKLVAKKPLAVGGLRVTVMADRGKARVKLEVSEREGTDAGLTRCVKRALARLALGAQARPSAAIATLSFGNTRAEGERIVSAAAAERADVELERLPDGSVSASWSTERKELRFVVRAGPKVDEETVKGALWGLRSGFASLMDCRRRAQKLGLSSAGETLVTLRLRRQGRAAVKVRETTVAHKRAPVCIGRALGRLSFPRVPKPGRVDLTLTFSE